MNDAKPPSGRRLWAGLLFGMLYLVLVAAILSPLTQVPFHWMLSAVAGVAASASGLALLWMFLWARRKDSRLGQFTVGSLLFVMLFVSLYLSFVGWVASHIDRSPLTVSGPMAFPLTALICLLLAVPGFPLLARATESVVWLAALAVRSRLARRWLAARRRPRSK